MLPSSPELALHPAHVAPAACPPNVSPSRSARSSSSTSSASGRAGSSPSAPRHDPSTPTSLSSTRRCKRPSRPTPACRARRSSSRCAASGVGLRLLPMASACRPYAWVLLHERRKLRARVLTTPLRGDSGKRYRTACQRRVCAHERLVTALLGAPETLKSGIFVLMRRDRLADRRFHRSHSRGRTTVRNLRAVDNGGYVDKRWIGEDLGQRTEITSLTLKSRIDQPLQLLAQNDALMPYGPNIPSMFRRAASAYAAKILKGANPAALPIERPSRFECVIALKTAKAPVARLRSWRAAAVARGGLTPAACG